MHEHFEPLEAAFAASYGLDLRRCVWGPSKIGVRRLAALVQGLPPGSALHRSLNPDGAAWGPLEELTAVAVELADTANRLFWQANFKGSPPGKPVEIKRPGPPIKQTAEGADATVHIESVDDLKAELAKRGRLIPAPKDDDNGN